MRQKLLVQLISVTCALAPWAGSVAQGQTRLTDEVALARLCISEAGWGCFESGDGIAIHEVISRGADHQGISYTSYARAYARRLFGARPHDVPRLRWVGQLTPACTEPEDWPTTATTRRRGVTTTHPHPAWSNFRERCLAVMARAREVVAEMPFSEVATWSVCDRPVHDWGGWMDRERARANGLIEVECGTTDDGTRNDFYCRPSLDPDCMEIDRD